MSEGGTAVPPGNCVTHGYHGRTYCPRCSTSASWGVVKSVSAIFLPWLVVLYVWWVGLHWTVIGMTAIYVASLLVAIGCVIGETRDR